ncbi:MAG: T9SS type A sorting domain-containing protein [Saprospiraceae bacterium]|nr:T9SS type A sorting domain-containing protein [Saprospiraceae bacterium]
MNKCIKYLFACYMCMVVINTVRAQDCVPVPGAPSSIVGDRVVMAYGVTTKAVNSRRLSRVIIGQPALGQSNNGKRNIDLGYYGQFLLPPLPPTISATQGELFDRIQLNWTPNPLGSQATGGYKIYRDSVFLTTVDAKTNSYNDFNIIAGRPYSYEVVGVNDFGEAFSGKALGFLVPNGVVTGLVETINGQAVPGAMVTLDPMQGFAAKFGDQDGAGVIGDNTNNFLPNSEFSWSISFWIKTESIPGQASLLKLGGTDIDIRAQYNLGEGIAFISNNEGTMTIDTLGYKFPDSTKNKWHHITLTNVASPSDLKSLYVDGVLVAQKNFWSLTTNANSLDLGSRAGNGGWVGSIDELRFYKREIKEFEIPEIMNGTAGSSTPDLTHYWKMDEELGTKSFDIVKRQVLYFCGAKFDADRPPVATSGVTNARGYYKIEGVNYGDGTTFIATPHKSHNNHVSLEFKSAEQDRVILDTIRTGSRGTIETWVRSSSIPNSGYQSILFRPNNVNIVVRNNNGVKEWGVQYFAEHWFGTLPIGFNHLAITIDSSGPNESTIKGFLNGNYLSGRDKVFNFNYADQNATKWYLGAQDNINYFNGFIDEVAIYDRILDPSEILSHASSDRSVAVLGLIAYFPLDEIGDMFVNNIGSLRTPQVNIQGASWSNMAPPQSKIDHVFIPSTRQVTLNPSNTSVDRIDFTDRSTIAVSGFVRFEGTDCFQDQVEILVNGKSFEPQIFTKQDGRFVIDFNPGTSAILTPNYKDHTFVPANYTISNILIPKAGVLFNNTVERRVKGVLRGGNAKCKGVITDSSTTAMVRLRTANGCFDKTYTVNTDDGYYEFEGVPPINSLTVSVFEHDIPFIYDQFQAKGGSTIDLSERDTVINFEYHPEPQVRFDNIADFQIDGCQTLVLKKGDTETFKFSLNEVYNFIQGNTKYCSLDTANFRIINGFADTTIDLTLRDTNILEYKFKVGDPNPSAPHTKAFQIIATTVDNNRSEFFSSGVVTGKRSKDAAFTTVTPDIPMHILHDPPGDGSYSYLEKNETICNNISFSTDSSFAIGTRIYFDFAPDYEYNTFAGLPQIYLVSTAGPDLTATADYHKTSDNGFEYCLTVNQRLSTSDNDLIVGSQGGDIFMGGALNIIYGLVDIVTFDSCNAKSEQVTLVTPGNFATTFIYSEWHILNSVLPGIELVLKDTTLVDSLKTKYRASITSWKKILENNNIRKKKATPLKNISFSAGTEYEYSMTSDTTTYSSSSKDTTISHGEDIAFDIFIGGVGFGTHLITGQDKYRSTANGKDTIRSVTTGYVLKDDDELDAFSVDIGIDTVYKTPTFNTKIGQSSCPWEPNTAKREGVFLESVNGPIRTDVPANEAATYTFRMHNISATNETWTYAFTAGPESNAYGAKIYCNGAPMNQIQWYAIPWGENIEVTVEVEKGAKEYDYDSLEIVLYSACEDQRANDLGILPDTAKNLYSAVYISAHFIRPCSEVNITSPREGWVLNGLDSDTIDVTLSGYNRESNFKSIQLQYRNVNGDGSWISIGPEMFNTMKSDTTPPKSPGDTLRPLFTRVMWIVPSDLEDGEYELRAVANCSGDAANKPGFSQLIKGRIDRQPPTIMGVPQPSDGVYHVGDEISFTFNQHIKCNKLIQAAGEPGARPPFNVGLFDAVTGTLIDVDITCYENKIIIDPNFQNEYFENRILKAELHNIEDLVGNKMDETKWEFYVDRNELAWLSDSISLTKYDDETKSITAKIHNRGGYPVPYTLIDIPSWIHAVPSSGTLVANEIEEVTFTVKDDIPIGTYFDSIKLQTVTGANPFFMGGTEAIIMKTRIICRPPAWVIDPEAFDPSAFEYSMNFIVELDIEGDLSADVEDIVGAYVGGELRGVAKLKYKPGIGYLAFLTVYSDSADLDTIEFQIWDASTCQLYSDILESFKFEDNTIIGSTDSLMTLHTSGKILRKIYIQPGWNWISMNLNLIDSSVNGALESLTNPQGATIKSQVPFSQYFTNLNQWFGSLDTLGPQHMYQYFSQEYDSISMVGHHIDSLAIPIKVGWNWIGYIPNHKLPVGTALATLNPQHGDLIKGRLTFAVYDNSIGWVGNLTYMNEPHGYLYKSSVLDTLMYPPSGSNFTGSTQSALTSKEKTKHQLEMSKMMTEVQQSLWKVDPSKFEHTMNFIAFVKDKDDNHLLQKEDEIGVFSNGELRGSSHPILIPQLGQYILFMTVYSNVQNEKLQLKYHSVKDDKIYDVLEEYSFRINQIIGTADQPEDFHIENKSTIVEDVLTHQLVIYPNPFSEGIYLKNTKGVLRDVNMNIRNADGQLVYSKTIDYLSNGMQLLWKPDSGIPSGSYIIEMVTDETVLHKNVIYIK